MRESQRLATCQTTLGTQGHQPQRDRSPGNPKGLRQSHLSEDAQRGNEQVNDDPKDVAAGHQRKHGSALVLAVTA